MSTAATIENLYVELESRLNDGDIDQSLELLEEICRRNPTQIGAWELRGHLQAKASRPNLSALCFRRASELGQLEPWSSRTMALQYVALGETETAAQLLRVLALSGQLSTGLLRLVSNDLLVLGHPDLAAEITWDAIKANPNEAILWHEISAIQSVLGESPDVCLATVEHAIQLEPAVTEFRVTAAMLLIRLDKPRAAYESVRHAVRPDGLDVDCPCCLWRLICIFDCFDDHSRMAVCYEKLRMVEAKQTFYCQ